MFTKELIAEMNEQIKWEMESAYLYLSMSGWFTEQGLDGFANWMKIQTQEEMSHAMRFYDFIHIRGGSVQLKNLAAAKANWKTPLDIFEATLAHEKKVTERLNLIASMAEKNQDHASKHFMQWFVTEQLEEEANASLIISKLKLIKNDGQALLTMDKELGVRTFVPAPPAIGGTAA